jgi:hypothetical protein
MVQYSELETAGTGKPFTCVWQINLILVCVYIAFLGRKKKRNWLTLKLIGSGKASTSCQYVDKTT